jgi:hypothetical protein
MGNPCWFRHSHLDRSFCPISSVCSPSAGVPATRHYLDTEFRTIRVVRERAIVKMDTEAEDGSLLTNSRKIMRTGVFLNFTAPLLQYGSRSSPG